jgi:hypothetical protein
MNLNNTNPNPGTVNLNNTNPNYGAMNPNNVNPGGGTAGIGGTGRPAIGGVNGGGSPNRRGSRPAGGAGIGGTGRPAIGGLNNNGGSPNQRRSGPGRHSKNNQ